MAEPCQCHTRTHPVARKEHRCCECGGRIAPGEKYVVDTGIFDGLAFRYRTCSDCRVLHEEIQANNDYDECPGFRELFEWIFDGEDRDLMKRVVEIRRKRLPENPIPTWMLKRIEEPTGAHPENNDVSKSAPEIDTPAKSVDAGDMSPVDATTR